MTEADIQTKVSRLITNGRPIESAAWFIVFRSAYWFHPSGKWVHAPKHADRIEEGRLGYMVSFGANSFLIGRAISRCVSILLDYYRGNDRSFARHESLKRDPARQVCGSVANYRGDEYPGVYPLEDEMMVFGTQGIFATVAIETVLMMTGTPKPNATSA
jgi:hypothetical protein